MEELKAYLESRIEYIVTTKGKFTKEEEELQKVLDMVNGQLSI